MTLRENFLGNESLTFENRIFYQKNLQRFNKFEQAYIALRKAEKRVYDDDVLVNLPTVKSPSIKREWNAREASMKKLFQVLTQSTIPDRILEVGCGNGWLSHRLAQEFRADVCGLDINEVELVQGARVFQNCQNLCFVYGDLFSVDLKATFDAIVLASSMQYFPNLEVLIKRLKNLLPPAGKILIADCPVYSDARDAANARKRSGNYFQSAGYHEMKEHYFHYSFIDLQQFAPSILYNPDSLGSRIQRKLFRKSLPLFPIIEISEK